MLSIYDSKAEFHNEILSRQGDSRYIEFDWRRIQDISGDKKAVFVESDPKSSDVQQGSLGDCWMIGALNIVGSRNELLRGTFNPNVDLSGEISDAEVSIFLKKISIFF